MTVQVEEIENLEDPRLEEYRWVGNPDQIVRRGLFVAEGHLVVRALLQNSRFRARSILVTPAVLENRTELLSEVSSSVPVYVLSLEKLRPLTGIDFHRGCLAIGERADSASYEDSLQELSKNASCVAVLEDFVNADNVGGVFRNALAFGLDALLLSPRCFDPLYRKAIRVSMGATLRVPFYRVDPWPEGIDRLHEHGYTSVALTPGKDAVDIREIGAAGPLPEKSALFLGTEGAGLSEAVLKRVQLQVRIPMVPDVDSLNVATASGIAMHYFSSRGRRS